MLSKDSPESRSLAAVIEREAKAATGLNLARRAFWHGGGFALRVAGAGLGAGVMLAGLGYGLNQAGSGYDRAIGNARRLQEQQEFQARMAQEQEQAEEKREKTFAAMMSQEREEFFAKLAATKLQGTVTGEVGLKDGGLVGLKTGQLVGVADGGQVTLKVVLSAVGAWLPHDGQTGIGLPRFETRSVCGRKLKLGMASPTSRRDAWLTRWRAKC